MDFPEAGQAFRAFGRTSLAPAWWRSVTRVAGGVEAGDKVDPSRPVAPEREPAPVPPGQSREHAARREAEVQADPVGPRHRDAPVQRVAARRPSPPVVRGFREVAAQITDPAPVLLPPPGHRALPAPAANPPGLRRPKPGPGQKQNQQNQSDPGLRWVPLTGQMTATGIVPLGDLTHGPSLAPAGRGGQPRKRGKCPEGLDSILGV